MIAIDANLLVYSHRQDSEFHKGAKELIDALRRNAPPWAIPWPCVHEFVAIVTHPRIYRPPSSLAEAFGAVDAWLAGGNVHLLSESPGYFEKLRELATAAQLKGPRIHDARIAALCLHHGVRELWTADLTLEFTPIEVKWTDNPSLTDAWHLLTFLNEHPKQAKRGHLICRCPAPLQLHDKVTAHPWFCL
jgi:toxin-antitoxin system PIN domain toxin